MEYHDVNSHERPPNSIPLHPRFGQFEVLIAVAESIIKGSLCHLVESLFRFLLEHFAISCLLRLPIRLWLSVESAVDLAPKDV